MKGRRTDLCGRRSSLVSGCARLELRLQHSAVQRRHFRRRLPELLLAPLGLGRALLERGEELLERGARAFDLRQRARRGSKEEAVSAACCVCLRSQDEMTAMCVWRERLLGAWRRWREEAVGSGCCCGGMGLSGWLSAMRLRHLRPSVASLAGTERGQACRSGGV
eukprot:1962369-Rhodomonas_salina.3